jgi:deoxyhypusine monooxygenase
MRIYWHRHADDGHGTVDPAPAAPEKDVASLEKRLKDTTLPVFQRYRALFTLRNLGGDDAIRVIAEAMFEDDSALVRHEAAYVLGQMQGPAAIPYLVKMLEQDASAMVRHEAAEALGNMYEDTDKVIPILERFAKEDPAREVRESCEVALDNMAYLKDPDQFDYTIQA